MNPFLACFLACALVQAISVVFAVQYASWKNRKEEAESAANNARLAAEHEARMAAIMAEDAVHQAEHEARMAASNARVHQAEHEARMAASNARLEDLKARRVTHVEHRTCPTCGRGSNEVVPVRDQVTGR